MAKNAFNHMVNERVTNHVVQKRQTLVPVLTRRALYGRIEAVLYCRTENTSILFSNVFEPKGETIGFEIEKPWKGLGH